MSFPSKDSEVLEGINNIIAISLNSVSRTVNHVPISLSKIHIP